MSRKSTLVLLCALVFCGWQGVLPLEADENTVEQLLASLRPKPIQPTNRQPRVAAPSSQATPQPVRQASTSEAVADYPHAASLWGVPVPQANHQSDRFTPQQWVPNPQQSAAYRAVAGQRPVTPSSHQTVSADQRARPLAWRPQHARESADFLNQMHKAQKSNKKRVSRLAKAQAHIDYGFDLARRGEAHSAEDEFIDALWTIAQAKDSMSPRPRHTDALRRVPAMAEAADFADLMRQANAQLKVAKIAVTHKSKPARQVIKQRLNAVSAMQLYLISARLDFIEAVGGDVGGSQALFGLARSYQTKSTASADGGSMNGAHAMALLLAAHQIDREDYKVSNELGVLYARYGDLPHAERMLKRSLVSAEHAESWHNLSRVWEMSGKRELAAHAGQRSTQLKRAGVSSPATQVRVVEPAELIASAPVGRDYNMAQKLPVATAPGNEQPKKANWFQRVLSGSPNSMATKSDSSKRTK